MSSVVYWETTPQTMRWIVMNISNMYLNPLHIHTHTSAHTHITHINSHTHTYIFTLTRDFSSLQSPGYTLKCFLWACCQALWTGFLLRPWWCWHSLLALRLVTAFLNSHCWDPTLYSIVSLSYLHCRETSPSAYKPLQLSAPVSF